VNFNAFGKSGTIVIADHCRQRLPLDLAAYVPALQSFFDAIFTPRVGIPVKVLLRDRAEKLRADDWPLPFVDRLPDKGVEGEHWLTALDRPKGMIGVSDTLEAGDELADCAAHEAGELAADPCGNINFAINDAQDQFVAAEPFDPTQALPGDNKSRVEVGGFWFPNFVLPAWFDYRRKPSDGPFDYLGLCERPLQVLEGGYISEFKHGRWDDRFGSHHAKLQFSKRRHARVARRGKRA
jgi:hypothetical protein